jgi:hypothetical protein
MTRSSPASRAGMTLVEMLVATAATLLLMAAIAQVFGAFGTAVSDSRAMIELDGRLRTAAWRLRADLAGATARTVPPLDPETGDGYFELIEGPESDTVSSGGVAKGANAPYSAIAGSGSDDRILGDFDDVLLFTTRSTDPVFQGRFTLFSGTTPSTTTIESPVAEVGWFLRPTPGTSNPVTFTLYRKQLLVLGYVGIEPFFSGGVCTPDTGTTIANTAVVPSNSVAMPHGSFPWSQFFERYDISARFERNAGFFIPNRSNNNSPGRLLPNTLADLTRREARFMHNVVGDTSGGRFSRDSNAAGQDYGSGFCVRWEDHNFDGNLQAAEDAQPPAGNGRMDNLHQDFNPDPVIPDGLIFTGNRAGEDVILTNVLAFDVRVFDPEAPIPLAGTTTGSNTALVPGDPGYAGAYLTSAALNPPAFAYGGYVDLGNGTMTPNNPPKPVSRFSGYGQLRSALLGSATKARVWDTWSTHYETNGRNDDGWLGNTLLDQGTNGLDDNNDGRVDETDPWDPRVNDLPIGNGNGVEDPAEYPGETETQPPYPYPLRGIEVRIRCYEPSSRQVRQVTIRHTFVTP